MQAVARVLTRMALLELRVKAAHLLEPITAAAVRLVALAVRLVRLV